MEKEAKAVLKTVRIAPRKTRLIIDLIRGKNVGNYAEIDWVLKLRDYESQIKLKENFSPPYFYEDDLQKYKNKLKKIDKSLILKLNPNFYKIKHLIYRNKGDQSNYSQFHFLLYHNYYKKYNII